MSEKKNIVLIVADQLRYDVIGKGYTPNIDALRRDSVVFNNAYCANPLCAPARGTIFTGLYPSMNGSIINPWAECDAHYGKVKAEYDNLYDVMGREGYEGIHAGKQHLFVENRLLEDEEDTKINWTCTERGFGRYLKEIRKSGPGGEHFRSLCPEMLSGERTRLRYYSNPNVGHFENGMEFFPDKAYTDGALEALKNRDTKKPVFLSLMYISPHPPLDVPSPYYEKSQNYEYNIPENVGEFYPHQSTLQAYNLPGVMGMGRTKKEWGESWKAYLGLVNLLDDCIGRVVEELKAQGIYDDSIILFSTDHGEMLGSHKLFQKMCMYEESTKVTFSLKLPQNECAGKEIDNVISHVDLLPTLNALTPIVINNNLQGENLLPLIKGETDENRNTAYIQYDGNGTLSNFQRCVVDGDYKLIVDLFKDETFFELYDVKNDPLETTNLLFEDGNFKKAYDCLAKLKTHMKAQGDHIELGEVSLEEFVKSYS